MMKKISVLGDSMSTFNGYTTPDGVFYDLFNTLIAGMRDVQDTWWMRVINGLGGQLEVNNSFSSTTVCSDVFFGKAPEESAKMMDKFHRSPNYLPGCSELRTARLGTPDIILVAMGTNDAGYSAEPSLFARDYRLMLRRLKRFNPQAEIWCSTLLWSYCVLEKRVDYYPEGSLATLEPYNRVIRDVTRDEGCHLADLAASGVDYPAIDCVHPNNDGMKILADLWLQDMRGHC